METVIQPKRRFAIDMKELIRYRELFYYFAWRDIKVRYKQTAIGAGWAIFQPLVTMVVFTLFFNKAVGISAGESVPYAIFSYSGLLFWQYFSNALTRSGNSLVDNQAVITKIYFPRIIPPISSTLVALIDFLVATVVFFGLMAYFHTAPHLLGMLLFIPATLLTFLAASGLGMFLAALNVKYRDIRQALPFFIQTGMFITPVIYPVTQIPERFQWILYLNPMTGIITAMRSTLLHIGEVNWMYVLISIGSTLAFVLIGTVYFRAKEREFADII